MTFEIVWKTSQYNWAFWFTHILGIVGVLVLLSFVFLVKADLKRKIINMITIIFMLIFITASTVLSIQIKWERRSAAAKTQKEKMAVANRDSANLAFSPIIGIFNSLMYIGIGMGILLIIKKINFQQERPFRLKSQIKNNK